MELTQTLQGASTAESAWTQLLRRTLPLWRYGVWATAMFVVLAAAASVRLEVQQLRKDLDRNARVTREARILNDRLRLEIDARRRAVAMEAVAAQLALGPEARIVKLKPQPPRTASAVSP